MRYYCHFDIYKNNNYNKMSETEDNEKKFINLFGRDVSQIPCFRNSFLYGVGTGVGTGFLAFMSTSRPQRSLNIGFATFFSVTFLYWFQCRYNYSKTKFEYSRLQSALQNQAIYEGTELEREMIEKSQSV